MKTEDGIKFVAFTNDLAILMMGKNKEVLVRKANKIINKVSKASENKKLPQAPGKTERNHCPGSQNKKQ